MRKLLIIVGIFCLGIVITTQADPNSGPYPVPGGGGGVTTNQLVPIQFTVGINTNDTSPPSSTTQFAWFTGTNNQYGAADAEPTAFSTPSAGSTNVMGIDSNNKVVLLNAGGWGAGGGGGSFTNYIIIEQLGSGTGFPATAANTQTYYALGNLFTGSTTLTVAEQPLGFSGTIVQWGFQYINGNGAHLLGTGTNIVFRILTNGVEMTTAQSTFLGGSTINSTVNNLNVATNWLINCPLASGITNVSFAFSNTQAIAAATVFGPIWWMKVANLQ